MRWWMRISSWVQICCRIAGSLSSNANSYRAMKETGWQFTTCEEVRYLHPMYLSVGNLEICSFPWGATAALIAASRLHSGIIRRNVHCCHLLSFRWNNFRFAISVRFKREENSLDIIDQRWPRVLRIQCFRIRREVRLKIPEGSIQSIVTSFTLRGRISLQFLHWWTLGLSSFINKFHLV